MAVKSQRRIVEPYFLLKARKLTGGNIRRIGYQKIKGAFQLLKEISPDPGKLVSRDLKPSSVFFRHLQGFPGDIRPGPFQSGYPLLFSQLQET